MMIRRIKAVEGQGRKRRNFRGQTTRKLEAFTMAWKGAGHGFTDYLMERF